MSKEVIKIIEEYPKLMVKGDANTPQRMWSYMTVFDEWQEENFRKEGYVQSNKQL